MSELLTIEEVADLLRVGRRTVERWLAEGEIVSVEAADVELPATDTAP